MDDVVMSSPDDGHGDYGGRVVSASCFRVLSLQLETQNEVEVLKPILEELEVLRLSCVLGALTTVDAKDFESELLEARDFDDEFARFMRSDVFGATAGGSGGGDQATGPSVRVVGLFGKQAQLKTQLQRLGGWDTAMNTKLRVRDRGMYAVVLPDKEDDEDPAVKTVVVFAWLPDEYFHADRLRETPAYLLRLLTCLTADVTCCLSAEDKQFMEAIALNDDAMGDDEYQSFSAAFYVEQQRDAKDDVQSTVEQVFALPSELKNATGVDVVKGSFPALKAIVDAPTTPSRKRMPRTFSNHANFCNWLERQSKQYDIRISFYADWPTQLKEAVLKKFGQWPRAKLAGVETRFQQSLSKAERDCRASELMLVDENLAALRRAGIEIFDVDALANPDCLATSLGLIRSAVQRFKEDANFRLTEESAKVLKLPTRLPKLLEFCHDLYKRKREDELRSLVKKAPYTSLKVIALQHTRRDLLETVTGWLSSKAKVWRSFREWMRVPLEAMKERWWAEVMHTTQRSHEQNLSRLLDEQRSRLVAIKETERQVIADAAFEGFVVHASVSEAHGASLRISSLQCARAGDSNISCIASQDEVVQAGAQLKVWAFTATATQADVQLRGLGELNLAVGETVRSVFTVQTRSILLVSSIDDNTTVRRIEFKSPTNYDLPSILDLRVFSRPVELCDYNNEDRLLVLADISGKIGIFRLDASFMAMENIRTVDMALKSSLELPFTSILLSNGCLFIVDHAGAMQSLNIRNQQTSRKKVVAPGSDVNQRRLFRVLSGGVLGWLDVERSASSQHAAMVFVASDDMRELPQSVIARILWSDADLAAYDVVGEFLFLVNAQSGKAYQVKLGASLRSESFRIRSTGGAQQNEKGCSTSGEDVSQSPLLSQHWLWTFYHVYEKFPVLGEMFRASSSYLRTASITLVCDTPDESGHRAPFGDGCRKFLTLITDKLQLLNKPLFGLDLAGRLKIYSERADEPCGKMCRCALPQRVTSLLRELVTFVPVQICRAELNTLTLMVDGKPTKSSDAEDDQVTSLHSSDIALKLRFGLLSPLLTSWCKQCIVITSMGKQSTGKSYFLNHLTGSSFAISGARCTDGVWISVRVLPSEVLLVVIDFEGLGSFERTEQEDVFLSVLNASVSMFTIFRMEMRLDKEIDELFSKFQKGARLIKRDPRLFRGKLFMSVKDVNPNDSRDVMEEFKTKFQCLLDANRDQNFLSDMYGGQLGINASPPLGTMGYYRSVSHVQHLIDRDLCRNPATGFATGKDFLDCIRLLLAKLSILDWTSLDESARRFKIAEATEKLPGVVRFGCFVETASDGPAQPQSARDKLVIASTREVIRASLDEVCAANPSMATRWRELAACVPIDQVEDDHFDLGPCGTPSATVNKIEAASAAIQSVFLVHVELLARSAARQVTSKAIQLEFDAFLSFVVRRRCLRVQKWSRSVFGDRVPEAWSVLEQPAISSLQTLLVRCLDSCSSCQLGCVKASVHAASGDPDHDCNTNHACDSVCSYCDGEETMGKVPRCNKPAGHEGSCECRYGDHTCGKPCLLERATNCGKLCTKKAGHEDVDHRCSVGLHKCGEPCAARGCSRQCVADIEVPHATHKCEVDRCLSQCVMSGCNRSCSSDDHFHGQRADEDSVPTIHICDVGHVCPEMCEQSGICHIDVMLKQSSKTFVGARSSFQYTFQEMNGSRRKCAFRLVPGQATHAGKHSCCEVSYDSQDDEASQSPETDGIVRVRHYCDVRCPSCSYYCQKAHGHSGLHKTTHGNMRNTMFVSEEQDIDLNDRKYAAGERGTAEMCNLYCSKMGRGHVHFLACDKEDQAQPCVYTGTREDKRRHCTLQFDPAPDDEQDEVLHDRYWDSLGWEDPCSSMEEREAFDRCPYKCDAPDHDNQETSYCALPVWHASAEKPDGAFDGFSYVGGHKFECSHVAEDNKMHHIFVLDASGSMEGRPWERLISAFREYIHNRILGGAGEDLVSVITFDHTATIVWEGQPIAAMVQAEAPHRGGGTSFVAGLRAANEVLSRVEFDRYKPVLVFFSDGYPADSQQSERLASDIAQSYAKYGLEAFVVGFGEINISVLERIGGSYRHVLTGEELNTTFESISASLGTRAGLALTRPLHEMICVVCQEELAREATRVLAPCQHELHQRCLRRLVDSSDESEPNRCPTCRVEIQVRRKTAKKT